MKRVLLALLLAASIAIPTLARIPVASIMPLTHAADTLYPACTASSINKEKKYWVTALHCVQENGKEYPLFLDGEQTRIIAKGVSEEIADVAILQATVGANAFEVRDFSIEQGESVAIVGYPWRGGMGDPEIEYFFGEVLNPYSTIPDWKPFPTVMTVAYGYEGKFTGPGLSGAPVFDIEGRLISVHSGSKRGTTVSVEVGQPFFYATVKPFLP